MRREPDFEDLRAALTRVERDLLGTPPSGTDAVSSLLSASASRRRRSPQREQQQQQQQFQRQRENITTPLTAELASLGLAGVLRFFESVPADDDPEVKREQRGAPRPAAELEPLEPLALELPPTRELGSGTRLPLRHQQLTVVAEQSNAASSLRNGMDELAATVLSQPESLSPARQLQLQPLDAMPAPPALFAAASPAQRRRAAADALRLGLASREWWNEALKSEKALISELARLDESLSKKTEERLAAKNAAEVAITLRSEKETRLKRRQERRAMQEQQIPAAHPSSLVHFSPLPQQQQQQQRVQFAQGDESTFSSAADVHIPLDVRVQVSVVPLGAATSGESSRRSGLAQGGARVIQYSQRTGRRERR